MFTCYFHKYFKLNLENGVSICAKTPPNFIGPVYKDLAPPWELIQNFKQTNNEQRYVEMYYKRVLNQLDPNKVYQDLKDNIILCYESSEKFCHRHIVAYWLNNNLKELGINVTEY